ncbi:MAG: aldo/keto reductase [Gammaproteobacteria bacterium]|nr:aldo/keto reductase [Gammaproteobacteria bacterium]
MPAPTAGSLRRVGRSSLQVPSVGIGTNNFGTRMDAAAAQRVVDAALELGAAFFDTADVYGAGQSEEFLGKALGARRSKAIIATKFGNPMRSGKFPEGGASRAAVMYAAEESLRRLGTDYIDLYQIHRPDPNTPIEETLRALDDLVRQGKVRYIGNSNFDAAQVEAAAAVSAQHKLAAFCSAQNHYSLLTRNIEKDLVPACERHGLGILPYFPLESGLLTGKYKRGEPPPEGTRLGNAVRSNQTAMAQRFLNDANFAKVEKLQALADAAGNTTLLDIAIGWLLSRPYVACVIAGATKPEQVEANVKAAAWRPSAEIARQIDAITLDA